MYAHINVYNILTNTIRALIKDAGYIGELLSALKCNLL